MAHSEKQAKEANNLYKAQIAELADKVCAHIAPQVSQPFDFEHKPNMQALCFGVHHFIDIGNCFPLVDLVNPFLRSSSLKQHWMQPSSLPSRMPPTLISKLEPQPHSGTRQPCKKQRIDWMNSTDCKRCRLKPLLLSDRCLFAVVTHNCLQANDRVLVIQRQSERTAHEMLCQVEQLKSEQHHIKTRLHAELAEKQALQHQLTELQRTMAKDKR